MPYCENCGTQINPEARFCKNCGTKLNPIQAAAQTYPQQTPAQPPTVQPTAYVPPSTPVQPATSAPPQPIQPQTQAPAPTVQPAADVQAQPQFQQSINSSKVFGTIVLKKPKSFGRWDTFTGVLTAEQFIIAQMTSDMIKDAAMQARDQAKAEGKGFWGQWSDQLNASFGYTKRYLSMQPAAIIAETPGNFAINNSGISEIRLKLKHINNNYDSQRREWEVEIHSTQGKYEFKMDDNSEFVSMLKNAYPGRVKTPFGYSSHGVNIKLF